MNRHLPKLLQQIQPKKHAIFRSHIKRNLNAWIRDCFHSIVFTIYIQCCCRLSNCVCFVCGQQKGHSILTKWCKQLLQHMDSFTMCFKMKLVACLRTRRQLKNSPCFLFRFSYFWLVILRSDLDVAVLFCNNRHDVRVIIICRYSTVCCHMWASIRQTHKNCYVIRISPRAKR